MASELLEIRPCELKFTFEMKKQSSCLIQLGNKSNEHVAFKVKTTSPKKYCVRPNTGVIKPNATCDFTVTMQAQKVAPLDLQCKDKFLIQSTIVPGGTTEDEITSAMFLRDGEKYIEEKKLRVSLISPPDSPVRSPKDGESKHEQCHETSIHKKDSQMISGLEKVTPHLKVVEGKEKDELRSEDSNNSISTTEDLCELDGKPKGDFDEEKPSNDSSFLHPSKDSKDLTVKLSSVDSKLKEAELIIMKLREEKKKNTREKEYLKNELELMKKNNETNVQVGFTLFNVFMIALIGMAIGYFIRS